jgi:undecaprenyl pyrophosphate synthase
VEVAHDGKGNYALKKGERSENQHWTASHLSKKMLNYLSRHYGIPMFRFYNPTT